MIAPSRYIAPVRGVLLFSFIHAHGKIDKAVKHDISDDSMEACHGKQSGDDCEFRLPVVDDRLAYPDIPIGELQGGVCNKKGAILFCRATPSSSQVSACEGKNQLDHCSFKEGFGKDTWVRIQAFTQIQRWASTKGAVYAAFEIEGVWTTPMFYFKGIARGHSKTKVFKTSGWPDRVAFTVNSNDAWGFWKITINDTVITEDPAGVEGSTRYCSYHPPYFSGVCEEFRMSKFWIEGPPASQFFDVTDYGSGQEKLDIKEVAVAAHTSSARRSETTGCIYVRFKVGGKWHGPVGGDEFFCGADQGEVKKKKFQVPGWPSQLWIAINSTDTWGFWKLTVDELTVVEDRAGKYGSHEYDAMSAEHSDTSYWLESPPRTITFDVVGAKPGGAQGEQVSKQGKCETAWNEQDFCDDSWYIDKRPETASSEMESRMETAEALEKLDAQKTTSTRHEYHNQQCDAPQINSGNHMVGSRCSLEEGKHVKVCAFNADMSKSNLCSLKDCALYCQQKPSWCTAFSFSNYQGARNFSKTMEQCYIFSDCHVMDDHDAYVTWYPSCLKMSVVDDAPIGQRPKMSLQAWNKAPLYKDVDDETLEDVEFPIVIKGSMAGVIVGAAAAGCCFLVCIVVGLLVYVRKLQRKVRDTVEAFNNPESPNYANNLTVAVGRPVAPGAGGESGNNSAVNAAAVASGTPVVDQRERDDGKSTQFSFCCRPTPEATTVVASGLRTGSPKAQDGCGTTGSGAWLPGPA